MSMNIEQPNNSFVQSKTKPILQAINIMENTSARYRALIDESDEAMFNHDLWIYQSKGSEAANLLINLPNLLEPVLDETDVETRASIMLRVWAFSSDAKRFLEKNIYSWMGVILNKMGDKIDDKNQLEIIIYELRLGELTNEIKTTNI